MRTLTLALAAFVLLPVFALACSGNAVVEPGDKNTKRAKAFIEKCQPAPPPDGTKELKEVYACLPAEDGCPDPSDPVAATELGYILEKHGECGNDTVLYDVPCGPDLNAIDCCYVARIIVSTGLCL
jgi:hypothetical protein